MTSHPESSVPAWIDSRTEEEKGEILRQRAIALARRPAGEVEREQLELVAFALAGERYAIETRFVREAIRRPRVARIPGADPAVLGVTTWRGELLTVFDARQLLSLPATSAAVKDPILLVLGDRHPVGGTLVDGVEGVLALALAPLHEPPEGGSRGEFIRGMGPDGLALLDGGRIVSSLS